MTTSNHASAGTQVYGYNHVNQRVFVRNGNTVTYYLYGLGGERLMEFQETCTGGACTSYTETQRWIYFAGRKMFQKTGTTLKAITPNRLASEAKHFPYGETDGTPPADTKDYFATYRRDTTGLDYAWNRYYSPTMGRFTTADPYGGSQKADDPESWNRYGYVKGNPVNGVDPQGLECQGLYADPCFDTTGTARMPGGPVGSPTPGGWFGGAREPNGPPLEQPPEGVGVIVSHGSPQFTDCEDMAKKVPRGFFGRIVSTIQEHIYNNVRAIVDPTKAQQEISWAASTTSDFFTGNGASHRYYSRSDTPIEALMTSRWVGDAVYHFLEKNSDKARNEWQSLEGFQMPFDPWEGPYAAGLNPVQQFLGSATIDIHPGENSISIVVYNNTSFPSLSYHLPVPDWERPGPMGNLRQYYHLVVPCN